MQINSSNNSALSSFRANVQNTIRQSSQRLSSGLRINSAADDAAGLAISKGLEAQIRSLNQGTRNALDMDSALRTADSGLSGMSEGLIRIRELALQASNGTLSSADRQNIQAEVNQQLSQIQNAARNTQFNTMQLLDGSFADMNMASNPDGSGMTISIANTTLESLGIANFDVTSGNIDLTAIDNALNAVNAARGNIGAVQNRIEFNVQNNQTAAINLEAARSRIADADMAREASRLEQARVLQQYQNFAFNNKLDGMRRRAAFIGIAFN